MLRLFFVLALGTACCFGKDPQLHGRVLDPSKSPIAQADIDISSLTGRLFFKGAADSTGSFVVGLAPGKYQLSIHKNGFTDRNVAITMGTANKQITVSLSLKTETISVTV